MKGYVISSNRPNQFVVIVSCAKLILINNKHQPTERFICSIEWIPYFSNIKKYFESESWSLHQTKPKWRLRMTGIPCSIK